MIAATIQFITFARSLSAKIWLVTICLVAMLTLAARLVTFGEHREAERARPATIPADIAHLRVARAEQGAALAHLAAARPAIIAAAIARARARKPVILNRVIPSEASNAHPAVIPSEARNLHLTAVDSLPPAIIALIDADDAQIRADSIYIAAAQQLASAIPNVELAHAVLDTVLVHPIQLPDDDAFWRSASRIVERTGVALIAHAIWTFLHH